MSHSMTISIRLQCDCCGESQKYSAPPYVAAGAGIKFARHPDFNLRQSMILPDVDEVIRFASRFDAGMSEPSWVIVQAGDMETDFMLCKDCAKNRTDEFRSYVEEVEREAESWDEDDEDPLPF